MIRFFFSLLLSVSFLVLSGQSDTLSTIVFVESYAPLPSENALLWEISGKEGSDTSYLYGTIHLIGKEHFFLTDACREKFSACEKIVFELDTDEMFDISTQISLLMNSFMENGVVLKDLMTTEEYALVKQHFEKIGLPLFLFERVKPMILSLFASEDMMEMQTNMDHYKSYELVFAEMAKQQGKEIVGLETVAFQMSMFDSIPYDLQAKMLLEAISSEGAADNSLDDMVELYKNQDIFGMQQMIDRDTSGIGKYEDVLLIGRNENWIPIMENIMNAQSAFFAVGAGHLPGTKGVIALLRKAGYKVVPIK